MRDRIEERNEKESVDNATIAYWSSIFMATEKKNFFLLSSIVTVCSFLQGMHRRFVSSSREREKKKPDVDKESTPQTGASIVVTVGRKRLFCLKNSHLGEAVENSRLYSKSEREREREERKGHRAPSILSFALFARTECECVSKEREIQRCRKKTNRCYNSRDWIKKILDR